MQQSSQEEGGESEPRPRPEESREVAPLDAAEVEHSEGDAEVLERRGLQLGVAVEEADREVEGLPLEFEPLAGAQDPVDHVNALFRAELRLLFEVAALRREERLGQRGLPRCV